MTPTPDRPSAPRAMAPSTGPTGSRAGGDEWGERTLLQAAVPGVAPISASTATGSTSTASTASNSGLKRDPAARRAAVKPDATKPGAASNGRVVAQANGAAANGAAANGAAPIRQRPGAGSANAAAGTGRRRPPGRARRVPFAVLLAGVVAAGMCGLLALNTATAASEVRERRVDAANSSLSAQQEQLSRQVAAIQAPAELSRLAARLGLVPAGSPAFLRFNADGTVTVLGSPGKVPTPPRPLTPAEKVAAKAAITKAAQAKAARAKASKAAASTAAASKTAASARTTTAPATPTKGTPVAKPGASATGTGGPAASKPSVPRSGAATTGPGAPTSTSAKRTPTPPTPTSTVTVTVPGGPR